MKHALKFIFSLITVFFSFFLCTCSFLNLSKNTSSLAVKLPQPQVTRSIPYDGENILFEDGKLPRGRIDFYEITITSADGETIPKSVPVGTDTIVFDEISVGSWTVEFKAYAVDSADKSKKIIVAKNRNPIKVEVKSGETANVDVIAYIVKYYTGDCEFSYEISMNVSNPGYQLKLPDSYTLPISELIKFEVQPGDGGVVTVTKDGLIIPKKTGRTTIGYSRLQDGALGGEMEVKVLPVVKINCYINGVNVSGKYPWYTKFAADDGDTLCNMLMNYSLYSIKMGEGLGTCDWYYDSDYTEEVSYNNLNASYDLRSKYYELEESLDGASTVEINLYADTRRTVKINCFINGENVSEEFSALTTIHSDNESEITSALRTFPIDTIMSEKSLTCNWYYDSDYFEKAVTSSGKINLSSKYNELKEGAERNIIEINLYADTRRSVGNLDELKAALTDGGSGDIIFALTCTLSENLEINIVKNVRLYGADSDCGFKGNDQYHIVITGDNSHSLELVNLTFQNGYAGSNGKGGVINATRLSGIRFKNCNFNYNKVYESRDDMGGQGGSIYLNNCSSVSVEDCRFLHNGASALCSAGGFIFVDESCSNVSITASRFTGGFANHGGALGLRVSSTVSGCTFENNQGYYRGGGINIGNNAVVEVKNCTFKNNKNEEDYGQASDIYTCDATAKVSGCVDGNGNAITSSTCKGEDAGGIIFN